MIRAALEKWIQMIENLWFQKGYDAFQILGMVENWKVWAYNPDYMVLLDNQLRQHKHLAGVDKL